MIDFLKETWAYITAGALSLLWIGGLETRVSKLEESKKLDPVMTQSMCVLKHVADGKVQLIQDEVVKEQIDDLKDTIEINDKKLRELIEARHNDLIFLIKSFYERKP